MASQQDALSLDLTVLEALLRRNRSSHGRTLYFKRMSMAVRAIQRHFMNLQLESLRQALDEYVKTRQEWTLHGNDDAWSKVKKHLAAIKELLEMGVPEILSRIDYAASALFVQVARGFFLPLCIVALGCLARIRLLIIRQARQRILELQSLLAEYKDFEEINAFVEPTFYETTLKLLVEQPVSNKSKSKFDAERTLQSLGLTRGRKPLKTVDTDKVMDEESGVDSTAEIDETMNLPAVGATDKAVDDDIGESVTGTVSLVSESVHHGPQLGAAQKQDDSDKNMELLQQVKTTDRKRAKSDNGGSEKKKKKRRKKESKKKKKKKDVFDKIFGD